ncbi:MAG: lipopolysaccharide heptosyltransferase II [Candidatus Omnitrophica bacterium]|nr:lipopolysaccharide heptosyltransferase II [Candidatus Omnitrophota bacterium]
MERILIFNVNWLGDVLFSTACIRNIRRNFPDSFIACIIPSRCYPILKNNPHLDETIIYDEKDRHKGMLEKLRFVRFLKAKRFDAVFILHRSFTRALICRLADIPERIGYYTKKRGFLLTRKIIPPDRHSLHRIDYYLNLIEKAGLKCEDRYLEFFLSDEDEKSIDEFFKKYSLGKDDLLVGFNPGGNWIPKRWPREYWARLADELIDKFKAKVIITGGLSDITLARDIQAIMRQKPINVSGMFTLKQLAALCKRLDLFITADTGPLHIANAVNTKRIVALFGPTAPSVTGPYPTKNVTILQKDVGCQIPCYVVNCKDNRCMKAITVEEVVERVKDLAL